MANDLTYTPYSRADALDLAALVSSMDYDPATARELLARRLTALADDRPTKLRGTNTIVRPKVSPEQRAKARSMARDLRQRNEGART